MHIPFCLRKCSYCDFYSLPRADTEILRRYTDCLIQEFALRAQECRRPFTSIYFGGGTPSLLSPPHVEAILAAIYGLYQAGADPEITIEVNPATIDRRGLEGLRRAGVNRLSVGVQSFDDRELKLLGRMHDSRQARQCIDWCHQAGFDNISLDLIYGIPGQSGDRWRGSLMRAIEYGPQHISTYLLQMEPGVPLARRIASGTLAMLSDDEEAGLYGSARECLQQAGYIHYELSNFSRAGFQCRHNVSCWRGGDYLGAGVGAVSRNGHQRFWNTPPLQDYLIALSNSVLPPQQVLETMNPHEQLAEALVMGLRLLEGVEPDRLCRRYGSEAWAGFQPVIERLLSGGLLSAAGGRIYLSPGVYFVSNAVLSEFME